MKKVDNFDFEQYSSEPIYGRIITYSPMAGYGFAITDFNKEIFLSSYNFIRKHDEDKAVLGAMIRFRLAKYNDRICADRVEVLSMYPNNLEFITLPDRILFVKSILRFGRGNLLDNEEHLKDYFRLCSVPEGEKYQKEDCDCLYFELKNGETLRYFNTGTKLYTKNQIDIEETYKMLCSKLYAF